MQSTLVLRISFLFSIQIANGHAYSPIVSILLLLDYALIFSPTVIGFGNGP